MEKHCKWYNDEFCTNGDSPCVADYCPVVQYPELCKHREVDEGINVRSKMEEKKLTDEEIMKALECCKQKGSKDTCKYCYTCPASVWDFEEGITECNVDLFQKAINLIHRLQDDYSKLKERYVKVLGLNEKVIAEQKIEIERLTAEINQRREMMSRMDCNYATELQKNAEIQKQVKRLTEENEELHNDNTTLIAGSILQKEQVKKDVAKKILKWLKAEVIMTEIPHGSEPCEEDVEAVMWWQIKEHFKKKYGVEVE